MTIVTILLIHVNSCTRVVTGQQQISGTLHWSCSARVTVIPNRRNIFVFRVVVQFDLWDLIWWCPVVGNSLVTWLVCQQHWDTLKLSVWNICGKVGHATVAG